MTEYLPVRTAAPAAVLDRATIKQHLRVDHNDEDALIDIYTAGVVGHLDGASGWLGRAIMPQSWSQQFDGFTRRLRLKPGPVTAITSAKYFDADGVDTTIVADQYALVNGESSAELVFIDDYSFPVTRDQRPTLTVVFASALGADDLAAVKIAILLMIGDAYQNREMFLSDGAPANPAARVLLNPIRRGWMA